MPYQGGIRLKLLNLIEADLEAKLYCKDVILNMPTAPPAATKIPAAYVTITTGTTEGITSEEKEEEMRLSVILFVRSDANVDRVKLEALDRTEEVIQDLQKDADFTAIASLIDVENWDGGPLALASYGLEGQITPPLGAIRVDVRITFLYTAFN